VQASQTTSGAAAEEVTPQRDLGRLIDSYLTTQLLYVAARLGVADVLADGPRSGREAADVVASYDFAGLRELVDVAGGSGVLLETILRATADLRGVLVDRPEAVERAGARLAAAGLDGRAECVAGDFFDAVPPGADAYLLSRVLHDWDDADARRILTACREAMPAGARLLVVDAIVPERAQDGPEAVRMDIHMLILLGARERTEAEFRDLLASAGFALRRVVPTASPAGVSLIEATVAAAGR
jgi:O-methyltransferase domain